MNEIIHIKTLLDCDVNKAFTMFSGKREVSSWLAVDANIELRIGGKYELFWDVKDRMNNSTVGCRINGLELGKFIAFEWKGPIEYKTLMNNVDPLTQVIVFFSAIENPVVSDKPQTEIHLIHTGWRNTEKWEDCRRWFFKAWESAFKKLKTECLAEHSKNSW
ncbi:MAG: SRPBCC domain-containing protein [Candidatus Cloacimonetes bacterium]|nr:SRPBCC domain-containing protein [Candidatus Cloacimonadota bacterium]